MEKGTNNEGILGLIKNFSLALFLATLLSSAALFFKQIGISVIAGLIFLFVFIIFRFKDISQYFNKGLVVVSLSVIVIGLLIITTVSTLILLKQDYVQILTNPLYIASAIVLSCGYALIASTFYVNLNMRQNAYLNLALIICAIPLIWFVGWMMVFLVTPGELLPVMKNSKHPIIQQKNSDVIYQSGRAILRSNGVAMFNIYSNVSGVKINEAVIEQLGLTVSPNRVSPNILVAGINSITVNFGLVELKEDYYECILKLDNNSTIKVLLEVII
ncbi:hypothetical protein HS7_05120 [Sulfolobales archaeon HS-7]|nr:hypothetical protein HS7_05120 [Sulfolobales archaeon HS-7]